MTTRVELLTERDDTPALGGVYVGPACVRRALYFSLLDGISATVMVAITDTFGVAAAVALGAPSMAIAILGSAPLFLGSVGQYVLPAFVDIHRERKRWVLRGVALQTSMLALAAISGFLPGCLRASAYVATFILAGMCANATGGAWTSWMGDLVRAPVRGRHFAWRSRVFSFANLSCALTVGLASSGYTSRNSPWLLFAVVFFVAALFRFVSLQMLRRQFEPKSAEARKASWRARPTDRFKRFAFANGLVQGATAMSGPFFTVFYLRDLRFDYLMLAINGCAAILGSIVSLPFWGRLADRIGHGQVLKLSGILICVVPIPYCFTANHGMICLLGAFGGACWAGYNLVSFNTLLNLSDDGDRTSLIAYASAVTGVIVFLTTLLGGYLSTRLPLLFAWRLQTLFLLSGVFRFAAVSLLFRRPDESSSTSLLRHWAKGRGRHESYS